MKRSTNAVIFGAAAYAIAWAAGASWLWSVVVALAAGAVAAALT